MSANEQLKAEVHMDRTPQSGQMGPIELGYATPRLHCQRRGLLLTVTAPDPADLSVFPGRSNV